MKRICKFISLHVCMYVFLFIFRDFGLVYYDNTLFDINLNFLFNNLFLPIYTYLLNILGKLIIIISGLS